MEPYIGPMVYGTGTDYNVPQSSDLAERIWKPPSTWQQDAVSDQPPCWCREASWSMRPLSVTTRFLNRWQNYSESISLLRSMRCTHAKLSAPVSCRYIRSLATNNGIIAAGNPVPEPAWLFCDEILGRVSIVLINTLPNDLPVQLSTFPPNLFLVC